MGENLPDPHKTRASLLERLKDRQNHEAWSEFKALYEKLIYSVALRFRLRPAEADEVFQETLIRVSRNIEKFKIDAERGSFRGWLIKETRWRVIDQLRKRIPHDMLVPFGPADDDRGDPSDGAQRFPDPSGSEFEAAWEDEENAHLEGIALSILKRQTKEKQFQIFHLNVIRGLSGAEVTKQLGGSRANVYVVKTRLAAKYRAILRRLRDQME